MIITNHVVSAPLNAYIDGMRYCEGRAPYPHLKVLPIPSINLMINFDGTYHCYKPDRARPFATCAQSWSVGLWNTYHTLDWPRNMQLLIVSFRPGGAYPFLHLPLSELHNGIVALDAIWGNLAAEIRERLYDAPTIKARFGLLERLLLARLSERPRGLNAVQYAVAEIARSRGELSIRILSEQIGISQKHLITQFKQLAGATPKELARIYRFRNVLFSLDSMLPIDWSEVAYRTHYYDQSHFNKDFKAFTGHNPTDFLRLHRQILIDNPVLAAKYLPTG